MAFPKCAFAVVRRLASGSGPPWSFTFTWSFAPPLWPRLLARPAHAGEAHGRH
jgi:hypothetical protein